MFVTCRAIFACASMNLGFSAEMFAARTGTRISVVALPWSGTITSLARSPGPRAAPISASSGVSRKAQSLMSKVLVGQCGLGLLLGQLRIVEPGSPVH
ncbi:hypothetical protein SAMN06272771_5332 [Streptomyces sp. Ag82_O1-12]|nr:hypothetical protein SAMN06272771_5332 [Streptomyces sp. Ag82_O1-12]SOD47911.1 hypothetical protein SAMN06272727_5334 [Streptomyces sp. Ag82_G6-1]